MPAKDLSALSGGCGDDEDEDEDGDDEDEDEDEDGDEEEGIRRSINTPQRDCSQHTYEVQSTSVPRGS